MSKVCRVICKGDFEKKTSKSSLQISNEQTVENCCEMNTQAEGDKVECCSVGMDKNCLSYLWCSCLFSLRRLAIFWSFFLILYWLVCTKAFRSPSSRVILPFNSAICSFVVFARGMSYSLFLYTQSCGLIRGLIRAYTLLIVTLNL